MFRVRIPRLIPLPLNPHDPCTVVNGGQPILAFKEPEIDEVRYRQWKASLSQKPRTESSRSAR